MLNTLYPLFIQTPFGTPEPGDSGPLDFSDPFNTVVFIILPIILVVLFVYWKRSKKNEGE